MKKVPDKAYINTTVDKDMLTALKVLAAQKGMRINQLLEEAMADLLLKYKKEKRKTRSAPLQG